jgi:hypothetical protein
MPEKATSRVSGVINTAEIYPRDEFLDRMRWGKHAWRTACRNGLRVLRAGGRAYVLGSDLVEYLSLLNDQEGSGD